MASTPTTTTLTSIPNPSTVGQSVTFTATVAANAATATTMSAHLILLPGGNVSFLDGAVNLGTVPLSGGVATLATTSLTAGSHNVTAAYGGGGGFAVSNSPILVQQVAAAGTPAVPTLGTLGLILLGLGLTTASLRLIRR